MNSSQKNFFDFWPISSLKSGTKSTGKTAWVTALLPYFCLTSLLIGVYFQQGSVSVGLKKYLSLNVTHLLEPELWGDAAQQIFYSQGPVWGCLFTLAFVGDNKMKKCKLVIFTTVFSCTNINLLLFF